MTVPMPAEPCLSVVMPCYNEEASVAACLEAVLASPYVAEVLVIDDCSSDGSAAIVGELAAADDRIRLHRHLVNQGKGAALRTGFALATPALRDRAGRRPRVRPRRVRRRSWRRCSTARPTSCSVRASSAAGRTGCSTSGTRSATGS